MESDHNKRLETAITRELQKLPALIAPDALVSRVMAVLAERALLPWYRRSWQAWPVALKIASLAVMLALFGGLCFAGWKFAQAQSLAAQIQKIGEWFSAAGVVWNTLSVLAGALVLFVKQLGAAILIASLLVAVFSYAACIGLGTLFIRHAFVGRQENQL